jgi:hypothetical protein
MNEHRDLWWDSPIVELRKVHHLALRDACMRRPRIVPAPAEREIPTVRLPSLLLRVILPF